MIDMRGLHKHPYYPYTLSQFQQSFLNDCTHTSWKIFKTLHLSVTHDKCPICECNLDGSVTRESANSEMVIRPTVDHYRPKDVALYPLLECDDKNYLLMCNDCNQAYKGNLFPLYGNQDRDRISASTENITTERPLIVNPIYDDLLELFILVFKRTDVGPNILELRPKEASGYLHEKAKETIKVFSLGNCEVNGHPNNNIQNCRISLLHSHYSKFYEFIEALSEKKMKKAFSLKEKHNLENYGFYTFILKRQFEDNTKPKKARRN